MKKIENSYKKSGVDISLANKLVKHISKLSKKDVKKTKDGSKKDVIGGFGSLLI
jgi:phosphoribosylaminoimidazole (AIR) synthetase